MNYIPFTYLIGWSSKNIWYYGSRTKPKCNPTDLWTIYFTSSKYVKQFRKEYGEPDIIEVRKTFLTRDDALNWEHKVLKRMGVIFDSKWLNKSDNKTYNRKGVKFTEDQKLNLKGRIPWNKGIKRSDAGVEKMRQTKKGKNIGKDNPNFGNKWSKEKRIEWSKRQTGTGNHFAARHHNEETKKKMSDFRKQYWQNKRNELILTEG